jgi:hypothetical protein
MATNPILVWLGELAQTIFDTVSGTIGVLDSFSKGRNRFRQQ